MSPRGYKSKKARSLVFCYAVMLLPACTDLGPQQQFKNYIERLARTLQVEIPELQERPVPAAFKIPKISELRQDLPPSNLGTLDFLSLSGCAVQITIGKRNSSLGLMATDSQRLLLELEYLQHAPQCVSHLRTLGRTELATILEDAFILKRQQLPALIFNATVANREFRQFWKKPQSLGDYPAQTSSAVLSALAAIAGHTQRWLDGDYSANNLAFEVLLSEVAKGDGGALLYALLEQESHLATANALLKQKLSAGPLCKKQFRDSAADVLPAVVQKFFIKKVQPHSAALGRRYHELLPAVGKLEALLSAGLPEKYEYWMYARDQRFSAMVGAPRVHVGLIKEALDSCGNFGQLAPAPGILSDKPS